jgi:metal-responsive CopG/Arc/MetJ family transcriptional regulator
MRGRYATVKIPYELAAKLDVLVNELGYRSRAEVVNDAIRRFLDSRKQLDELDVRLEQPPRVPVTLNNPKR